MKKSVFCRILALSTLIVLLGLHSVAAAELKAVRVKEGPKVDGLLTDTAWQAASAITGFRMVEPRPGEDPSEKTEARVLYDDTSLYIGVYCYD
ncbi:MAG: hypothetical protein IH583_16020, partial [Candidatus Aminicenantes bacterium]|nr:hypothetical protein [Candidatus Aminicenantes bacterium]